MLYWFVSIRRTTTREYYCAPVSAAYSNSPNNACEPGYICCIYNGYVTYSGTITDQEDNPLSGVVVFLYEPSGYWPINSTGSTTTNANGQWSITFAGNSCPHNAEIYWQSQSNGPLIKYVSYIPTTSSYTVNVWQTPLDTTLAYEFANTNDANISLSTSQTFTVSDNINYGAGAQFEFVGLNAAYQYGTTLTIQAQNSAGGQGDSWLYYQVGNDIKVEDTSGNYYVYKQTLDANPLISVGSASEYLSLTTVLSWSNFTYLTLKGHSWSSQTDQVTGVVSVSQKVGITAFGFSLGTEDGLSNSQETGVSIKITNSASSTHCYVIYEQGFNVHVWLYLSNAACP